LKSVPLLLVLVLKIKTAGRDPTRKQYVYIKYVDQKVKLLVTIRTTVEHF